MAKKISGYIKLMIPAGSANPSPPLGPALGQRGVNIMEFAKAFNAKTEALEKGVPTPTVITVYADKSFTFVTKTAPASYYLKKMAGKKMGSNHPGREVGGTVTMAQCREIAEIKLVDLSANDVDQGALIIAGSARSMGYEVTGRIVMAKKRMKAAIATYDKNADHSVADAVKIIKNNATVKFDETVEIAINLGVDPRHADQMVRGVCNLPNGTGRSVRVAVFAKDAKADEARAAGADVVGAEDLMAQIQAGDMPFDKVIATPDMMPLVGRLGKILGPKNMMPNPKVGTVTMDIAKAVNDSKGGAVEFRVEKAGIIHAGVGKASFAQDKLAENVSAFLTAIQQARPSGAKGTFIKKITLSTTMGPGVKIDGSDVTT